MTTSPAAPAARTTARLRPIDTSKALEGTGTRRYLDHLNEVLTSAARDLVRAPAARQMLIATLRHWARTAERSELDRLQAAGIDPARISLPLPSAKTAGVPEGDLVRRRAVQVLCEHGWLIPNPPHASRPATYRAEVGDVFGVSGEGAA